VDKEKEGLKAELTRMKQSAAENRAHLEALEMEERKLLKIISEADAERLRLKKELDQVFIMMMHYIFMHGKKVVNFQHDVWSPMEIIWLKLD